MVEIENLLEYNEVVRHSYFERLAKLSWKEFTKNREASFNSFRNIFVHTLEAIDYWLDFLKKEDFHSKKKFDEYKTFEEVESYMQYVEKRMHEYLGSLSTGDLRKTYTVTGEKHKPTRITAEDILIHVFEEEVHHRGELNALLWQMGIDPPAYGMERTLRERRRAFCKSLKAEFARYTRRAFCFLWSVNGVREFPKPIIVVSKCITFEPVRWNGRIIASEFVEKLKPYVSFVSVCPEIEIGLGVPRDPIRIVRVNGELRLLQPSTGLDFTEKMKSFAESFLKSLNDVDGFILKSGSPSSGFKNVKIYPKVEKSSSIARGPGFFGKAVLDRFPHLATEDERRLLNPRIREQFLTKLFAFASFRKVKQSGAMGELVRFQSENKYLLTAYNQKELRVLGRIVANPEKKKPSELINSYEAHLHNSFARSPSVGANLNVMMKTMGYFSHQLSKDEKSFFLSSLEKYKAGRLPSSASLSVLKAWIIRFKEEYLVNQTFLEPYPEQLAEVDTIMADSEGKDYWKQKKVS